ncbi:hypothetical protein T440DRAFT_435906 [Plenodomus tracheiphilus IPT5]|uniref:Uncharacterized protein n=1 Tax=Plenodomus tracheiphilus IPT5 TaxID=1408161 RepID=A0A6A7ANG8_9PLEO|nr:hypothetical protein T440DRAFT_435906 [Plenodomus tracheiphilus IPT5]
MDDHHQQPIWPMMQGAVDYMLNLAGEVWTMIWKPAPEARALPVHAMTEQYVGGGLDGSFGAAAKSAVSGHEITGI